MTPPQNRNSPRHGGNLAVAVEQYGGLYNDWLDLSTGISPWAYPVENLEQNLWHTLPSPPAPLLRAAAHYYGCELSSIHLSPGTQLAIRLLPSLIKDKQRVAIPRIGYQEHRFAWRTAGHEVFDYTTLSDLKALISNNTVDNAVVINPNNPSCDLINKAELLCLAEQLPGILLLDEAFADLDESKSLAAHRYLENIVVTRSLGKFFGLAGARVGFIISHHGVGQELGALFQPWGTNGASQVIAERALADKLWQQKQRQRVKSQSNCLVSLLRQETNHQIKSQGLFTTVMGEHASLNHLHHLLAHQKIWTRIGDRQKDSNWLRLSLPGPHFERLETAFQFITQNNKSHTL